MGATPRFNLRYPALTDAPNGPQAFQFLAEDAESWLSAAFPCTSTTRPTGVPDWFLIGETDTGKLLRYSVATSAWIELAAGGGGTTDPGGGGGGGGTLGAGIEGQYRADTSQDLAHNTNTVLGFGVTEDASDVVIRATFGTGHKFTLTESGCYAISSTIRFAGGDEGTRFIELENSARNVRFIAQGVPAQDGRATTLNFSLTKRFPAGQELVVIGNQRSGGSLPTQPTGDAITDGFVRLTIVKLTS